ncbi:MAG: hypothetical protein A3K19_02085 [Lentisphaerae bacterium RIFOXYB12_FULL_65_16]|nr:MAG: hypothetical protein A3K18_25305 [Lentisphaerae bacterium RIFOXYA12_64_32]OGV92588.1 MAG: hypothetical protein A3K19_02085 [Lentisphaerae bacterium RIFOXYB12_FULL_65_16]
MTPARSQVDSNPRAHRSDEDFDRHAEHYDEALAGVLQPFGEDPSHFDACKVGALERWMLGKGAMTPTRILDFGCGVGRLSVLLAQRFSSARVVGVDVSKTSLEVAAARGGNLANLSFSEQVPESVQFDLIIAANVLHHIRPQERRGVLVSLQDCLAPSGQVAIFEHNPWNPLTRFVVSRCGFDEGVELLSLRALTAMARMGGYEVVQRRYLVFFPRVLRFLRRRVEPALSRFPLGAQYMCGMRVNRKTA